MKAELHPPYACVVFDLDGTLLDTRPGMMRALNQVLCQQGLSAVDEQALAQSLHFGLSAMLAQALRGSHLRDTAKVAQLDAQVQRTYLDTVADSVRPFDHAQTLLMKLKSRGTWMAVCSNQSQASVRQLLKIFSLDDFFSEAIGGDTLARRKPDPLPLRWLMQRAWVAPQATLMVGDSEVDARCALDAGADVVLMAHGYGQVDLSLTCTRMPDFRALDTALLSGPRLR